MISNLIFSVLATLLLVWFIKTVLHRRNMGVTGPFPFPIIENIPQIVFYEIMYGRIGAFKYLFDTYGDTYYVTFPSMPAFVSTCSAQNAQHFTSTNFSGYARQVNEIANTFEMKAANMLFGSGIFNSDGYQWEAQRKIANPLFKKHSLENMNAVFRDCGVIVLNKIQQSVESGAPLDVQRLFQKYTLDTFGRIAFAVEMGALEGAEGRSRDFEKHFDSALTILADFFFIPYFSRGKMGQYRTDVEFIDRFLFDIIDNHHKGGDDLLSFFQSLTDENGKPYPKRWIRDVLFNFLVAGRDTTSLLLTWSCYCLIRNPRVFQLARKEIDENTDPCNAIPTDDEIKSLQYLDHVLSETLRLFPPVPSTGRFAKKPDTLPSGHRIESGVNVTEFAYFLHRNPLYWTDPETFLPERWEDKDLIKNSHQYMPFYSGKMQCIGRHMALQEAKLMLCAIIKNYDFSVFGDKEVLPVFGITLMAQDGMPLVFKERNSIA